MKLKIEGNFIIIFIVVGIIISILFDFLEY